MNAVSREDNLIARAFSLRVRERQIFAWWLSDHTNLHEARG
jgi:hypothetical protein